jgi:hypothetical protein
MAAKKLSQFNKPMNADTFETETSRSSHNTKEFCDLWSLHFFALQLIQLRGSRAEHVDGRHMGFVFYYLKVGKISA